MLLLFLLLDRRGEKMVVDLDQKVEFDDSLIEQEARRILQKAYPELSPDGFQITCKTIIPSYSVLPGQVEATVRYYDNHFMSMIFPYTQI